MFYEAIKVTYLKYRKVKWKVLREIFVGLAVKILAAILIYLIFELTGINLGL